MRQSTKALPARANNVELWIEIRNVFLTFSLERKFPWLFFCFFLHKDLPWQVFLDFSLYLTTTLLLLTKYMPGDMLSKQVTPPSTTVLFNR